jgi:hypothetical protein
MNSSRKRLFALMVSLSLEGACSKSATAPTAAPTPAPPAPSPSIAIAAPTPAGPSPGTTSFGWPTMTVANAVRTGTDHALVYRFDVSAREDFLTVAFSALVAETPGVTSYTPSPTQPSPAQGPLFWRAIAIDQANAVQSGASETQFFAYYTPTEQNRIALQIGVTLWPGARPPGTYGKAVLGPGWQMATVTSFTGVVFQSPPLEILQLFDLLDLGFEPYSAIDWLKSNGYATTAAYYPAVATFGFPYQYLSLVRGEWELVRRVGG